MFIKWKIRNILQACVDSLYNIVLVVRGRDLMIVTTTYAISAYNH
jgi:hypothetical protein